MYVKIWNFSSLTIKHQSIKHLDTFTLFSSVVDTVKCILWDRWTQDILYFEVSYIFGGYVDIRDHRESPSVYITIGISYASQTGVFSERLVIYAEEVLFRWQKSFKMSVFRHLHAFIRPISWCLSHSFVYSILTESSHSWIYKFMNMVDNVIYTSVLWH